MAWSSLGVYAQTPTPGGGTPTPGQIRLQGTGAPEKNRINFVVIAEGGADLTQPPILNIWKGSSCGGTGQVITNQFMLVTSDKKQASYSWDFVASGLKTGDTYAAQAARQDGSDKSSCIVQTAKDGTPVAEPPPEAGRYCPNFAFYQPNPPKSGQNLQYIFARPTDGKIQGQNKQGNPITLTSNDYYFKYQDTNGRFVDAPGLNLWYFEFTPNAGDNKVSWFQNGITEACGSQNINIEGSFNPKDTSDFDASCTNDKGKTRTTFGCIAKNPTALVNALLPIAIGIGGGLAFLLIVYGGFRLATSQGDPKAVQEAREIITGAIIGLLIMVLSVFILRLIGVNVLGLPI